MSTALGCILLFINTQWASGATAITRSQLQLREQFLFKLVDSTQYKVLSGGVGLLLQPASTKRKTFKVEICDGLDDG